MSGKILIKFLIVFVLTLAVCPTSYAQDCSPPAITANSKIYNIFSPEQEMILGDLTFQSMSGDLRFVRDQQLEAYLLVLHDSSNRILVFTINDGELQQRFFGSYAAISPTKNQIVVENYPGELTVYNLANGEDQARLVLGGPVAFLRFSLDGKRLFVLTDKQVAYSFDVEKLLVKKAAPAE